MLRSKIEEQSYIYLARQICTLFIQDNKSPMYKSTYCHLSIRTKACAHVLQMRDRRLRPHAPQVVVLPARFTLSPSKIDLLAGTASPASLIPSGCTHTVIWRAYKLGFLTQAATFTERDVGFLVLVFILKPPRSSQMSTNWSPEVHVVRHEF